MHVHDLVTPIGIRKQACQSNLLALSFSLYHKNPPEAIRTAKSFIQ